MGNIDYKVFHSSATYKDKDLVFINGLGDPYQNHVDIFERLEALGYRIVVINTPGHGETDTLDHLDFDTLVEIVNEVVSREELETFILGGFSMGGAIATKFAEKYPNKVQELRLLAPYVYKFDSAIKHIPDAVRYSAHFSEHAWKNPSHKGLPLAKMNVLYLRRYLTLLQGYEIDYERVKDIPLLILYPEDDELINLENVREFASHFTNQDVVIVHELTHDIYFVSFEKLDELSKSLAMVTNLVK